MKARRRTAIAGLIGMIVAVPVAGTAQTEPQGAAPGAAPAEKLDRARIDQFVHAVAEPMRTGQIARWSGPICSGVAGLKADQAEFLNGRIGELARLAGLEPDKAGCEPTILIYFSQTPDALAADFDKKIHTTLARDGQQQLAAFLHAGGPVRWISRIGMTGPNGDFIIKGENGAPNMGRMSNSRIEMSTRTVLASMIIIVDATKIGSLNLASLSDYIAMVALTRPKSGATPPPESILALFANAGSAPTTLTAYDRRYLTALYRMPLNHAASSQLAAIETGMAATGGR